MIRIFYVTRKGRHVMRVVPGLAKAARAIENLWKARIKAEAKAEDNSIVGRVEDFEGSLTWWCWNEKSEQPA